MEERKPERGAQRGSGAAQVLSAGDASARKRRGRAENGRRCTGGTATDAGEPAIASQLAAATVPEAHPTRESLPRRGARGEAGR